MPICSINLGDALPISPKVGSHSTRESWRIGDQVGFLDRNNNEIHGKIVRLNAKTASLTTSHGVRWTVGYSYLFPILETSASAVTGHRLTVDRKGNMTIVVEATPTKE